MVPNNLILLMIKQQQKRIRSVCYLLEYENFSNSIFVKNELFQNLGISKDIDCKYALTVENNLNNLSFVVVYLEFSTSMDFYSSKFKLTWNNENIKGYYKSVRDKELALRYVFKSANRVDIITNFHQNEINKYYRKGCYEQTSNKNKAITEKQKNRIGEMLTLCENEIVKSSPNLSYLKRFVNNITNYYSKKIQIPDTLDLRFQEVKKSYTILKKK